MKRIIITLLSIFYILSLSAANNNILVETELFQKKGGWILESQFINQMGSSYLMAHGLGQPVKDAASTVTFNKQGVYHIWVRTKDWAPFPKGPGKFEIIINGNKTDSVFGSSGKTGWHWYYGGTVRITQQENEIRLHDLTGFDGRCDAIYFTETKKVKLPETIEKLNKFREESLGLDKLKHDEGQFDLVVVGGGVAGISAAVQAARLGLKVALINNRPVLGGNSSSEIKISTDGDVFRNKYPSLGRIVREIDNKFAGIGNTNSELYRDDWRKKIVLNEPNISLFENIHINKVEMQGNRIKSVTGINIQNQQEYTFHSTLFSDCTGDADVGILAGAEFRYGRESKTETEESLAPDIADQLVMGSSNQWYAEKTETMSNFAVESWMLQFSDKYHLEQTKSRWFWETGFKSFHTVNDAEEIRDHNFRAIYGNWAYLKTYKPEKYGNYKLVNVSNIAGKRESYRLLGDVFLRQQDVQQKIEYPDAIVTTSWGIDLHYPDTINSRYFSGQEFIAYAVHLSRENDLYTLPYRCLYSRNIENLFMAGRNISVSHIALGTVRVQRCTGMMGEVVGLASSICIKNNCKPRDIYEKHWNDMLDLLK